MIYVIRREKDSLFAQLSRRKSDESKLTYAQYHGDIPADEDPADYYTPVKAVSIA